MRGNIVSLVSLLLSAAALATNDQPRDADPKNPAPMPQPSAAYDTMKPLSDTHLMGEGDAATAPLNPFAIALLAAPGRSHAKGAAHFASRADAATGGTVVVVEIAAEGLIPGAHGVSIHEGSSCKGLSPSHWNPSGEAHGAPTSRSRHLGDLGNLIAADNGHGSMTVRLTFASDKRGDAAIVMLGKPIVIHERADDFLTQPSGNAGRAAACGVIERVPAMAH